MRFRPQRYQCPKCRWEFAFRKKRCCPGCGTLLLIASDNPTDAELTELKSSWLQPLASHQPPGGDRSDHWPDYSAQRE